MKKRFFSILLSLCMVLMLFPATAFAEGPADSITINGPDEVCAQQDYEFTVTAAGGVTLDKKFGHASDFSGSDIELTIGEDGVGHGVVPATYYDPNTNGFDVIAHGTTADGKPVSTTKHVEVSPEHIYVDGVCGCGAVLTYKITYDGVDSEGSIPSGVKTHDKDFTLSSETFTREGYVQTGWIDEYGSEYDLGGAYTLNEDMTFYPVWDMIIKVPFTTTVKQGGNVAPGKTVFNLQLVDYQGNNLTSEDVKVTASITTNGAGSYESIMTITGPSGYLPAMLSYGVFVKQVDAGEDGWTYDDKVWGLRYKEGIPLAYDDEILPPSSMLIFPAILVTSENGSYYEIPDDVYAVEQMSFTNTYTKSTTEPTEPTKPMSSTPTTNATTSVQTGDNSNLMLWLVLLAVSAASVIGTGVYSRRRRSSRTK